MAVVSGLPEAVSLLRRYGGGGVRRAADLSRRDRRDPVCRASRTDAADGDAHDAKQKTLFFRKEYRPGACRAYLISRARGAIRSPPNGGAKRQFRTMHVRPACVRVHLTSKIFHARAYMAHAQKGEKMDEFASIIGQSVQQNNEWSARQAQAQMDFQERMSNTAFQRQMADLKAAGLNPVLAAKLGGASTPNGAMGDTDTSGTSALVDLLMMSMETANSAAGAARAAAESSDNALGLPLIKNPRQMWQLVYNYGVEHQNEIINGFKALFNTPRQFMEEYKALWDEDQLRSFTAPAHSRYGKAAKADQKKAEKAKSWWWNFLSGPTI